MLDRSLFSTRFPSASIAFVCIALAVPFPAMAGFQWVPPSENPQQQAPAVVIEGQAAPTPIPSSPPVTRAPQTLQLPSETPSDVSAGGKVDLPSAPQPASAGKEKVVRGFANNVPLAVALRQILPAEYGFSVGQDVQLSALVSWQGGRAWRPTLEDMLRTAGLSMREEGKMIQIVRSSGQSAPAPAMSSLAAPEPAPSLQPPTDSKPLPLQPSSKAEHALQPPPSVFSSSAAPPASAPQGAAVDSWTANRGETLRKVLEGWARRTGVEVSWQAEYDYPLQASITFTGTFEEAVRSLLSGFQEAQPQPIGSLHNSSVAGQTVLVVQTRGNNYSE